MSRDNCIDRFIPSRSACSHTFSVDKSDMSTHYSRIISPDASRLLSFSRHSAHKAEPLSEFIAKSISKKRPQPLKKCLIADKILDAPDVLDNFYYSLLDWGENDIVGLALDQSIFLLQNSSEVGQIQRNSSISITSLKITNKGSICLIGELTGRVEVYDTEKKYRLRTINSHYNRIGSLCQAQGGMFFSGSKDKIIKYNDLRLKKADVITLQRHRGQICGMSLSNNYLASGGNDNRVVIWDIRNSKSIVELKHHKSAIKGLAWCPWKSNLLATGGGRGDGQIILWNGNFDKIQKSIPTHSQICSLFWNKGSRQLVSGCTEGQNGYGYIRETIEYRIQYKLKGHKNRMIGMVANPRNEDQLCSIGADETLRFWNIRQKQEQRQAYKQQSETLLEISDCR